MDRVFVPVRRKTSSTGSGAKGGENHAGMDQKRVADLAGFDMKKRVYYTGISLSFLLCSVVGPRIRAGIFLPGKK